MTRPRTLMYQVIIYYNMQHGAYNSRVKGRNDAAIRTVTLHTSECRIVFFSPSCRTVDIPFFPPSQLQCVYILYCYSFVAVWQPKRALSSLSAALSLSLILLLPFLKKSVKVSFSFSFSYTCIFF